MVGNMYTHPWPKEQINILKEKYFELGSNIPELLTRHSKDSIKTKASRLKIKTKICGGMHHKKWTKEEEKILKEKYFEYASNIPELLERHHSRDNIRTKAKKLNLCNIFKWTIEEINILEKNAGKMRVFELSKLLPNRTDLCIKNRAYRTGISLSYTFCIECGKDISHRGTNAFRCESCQKQKEKIKGIKERIIRQWEYKQQIMSVYSDGYMKCNNENCPVNNIYGLDGLEVDHIFNNGAEHRKTVSHIDKWLIDNNFPEGFQILCIYCNGIKELKRKGQINKTEVKK